MIPRVVLVSDFWFPKIGGMERSIENLVTELEPTHRPTLLTGAVPWDPALSARDRPSVLRLGSPGCCYYPDALAVVRALGNDPVVVHLFGISYHWPDRQAELIEDLVRRSNVRIVLKLPTLGDLSATPTDLLRRLLRGVHTFVALTEDVAVELRRCGAQESQIARIPNGVAVDRFIPRPQTWRTAGRAALGLSDDRAVAVFAGRFVARKRIELLIDTVSNVPASVRPFLVVVGYQDDTFGTGTVVAPMPGIRVLPPQLSMPEIYPLADVYVSASRAEGMSNALLEAMACAVPGVVSDISGHRELVRHGENGWIFDGPKELFAVLEQLAELRRNGALAAAGLRARQYVCDGYTSAQVADCYRRLYSQLFQEERYKHA
jgi:glycosyltransferase involved in cell wall biosynthesis